MDKNFATQPLDLCADPQTHIKADVLEQPVFPEYLYWTMGRRQEMPLEQGNNEQQMRGPAPKKVEGENGHSSLSSDFHMSHGTCVPTLMHANAHRIIHAPKN